MTVVAAPPLALEIHVVGVPAPQGSKRALQHRSTGRPIVIESSNTRNVTWRGDVKEAAIRELDATGWKPPTDGVTVEVTFLLARPKGHYRTGKHAHLLRDGAPAYPTVKPDIDKLLRSTLDALKVAGCYTDDCNVVRVVMEKLYAVDRTGAVIRLRPAVAPSSAAL